MICTILLVFACLIGAAFLGFLLECFALSRDAWIAEGKRIDAEKTARKEKA